jgi:phage terminase large subunit-like protein
MGSSLKLSKEKEKYIEKHYKAALQYEEDVLSGKIMANKWLKLTAKRRKKLHKKYYFDEESVKKVFDFCFYVNLTVKGKITRFEPLPWMSYLILNIYGYYRDKEKTKRLFRYVLIWVARKNSKTTLAAILSLFSFLKEERNAEVYFLATTKDQSSQALRYLKQIVKDSPALRKRIDVMQYQLRSAYNGTSYAKSLPNEPDKLDGLSPSFAVIDERHALQTNELFNIIKTGTLARENPMIISISTAGFNKDYPFYNELEIGRKVLSGEVEDDSTFYMLFTLDSEEEVDDPKTWIKANPSLGVVLSLEDLIIDYKKASLTITDKINFKVKNLNLYADGETTWIPDEAYRRCFNEVDIKTFYGKKVYLGLDLSSTRDLSSLVAVIEGDDGKLNVFPEFYFPVNDNEQNKIRPSGIDLTGWIEKGWIEPHESRIIDYEKVYQRIKWYYEKFEVISLSYDRWDASILINQVESNLLIDTFPTPQTTAFFTYPMRYLERLIFNEDINLSKSPALRWNFRNVVIYTDTSGNVKPAKNKSLDSIDGVIALLEALGAYAQINFDSVAALMESFINDEQQ